MVHTEMAKKSPQTSEVKKLVIVLTVLIAILLGVTIFSSLPYFSGTTIELNTRPVDPFDPLRGQHMVIGYDIGFIELIEGVQPGQTVYTSVTPDAEGIWRFESASVKKPSGIFLGGRVVGVWADELRVEYGIERYFFERGAMVPTENITVEVKVSPGGQARIVQLLQNRKPVTIEYRPVSLTG